jgi:hypothetical protein
VGPPAGAGDGRDGGSSESADGASTGSGSAPVVKSYPQFSQKRAPPGAGKSQFGHVVGAAAVAAPGDGVEPLDGDATDAAGEAAPIGSPHTSQ